MGRASQRENLSSLRYEYLKRYLRSMKIKFKYITDTKTIVREGMIFLPVLVVNERKFDYDSAIEYIRTKEIKATDKVTLYGIPKRRKEK